METSPENKDLDESFIEDFCEGPVVEKHGEVEGIEKSEEDGGPGKENEAESLPRQRLPDPKLPTADEVAQHNIDHYPYRNWCRHCVEGRGRGERHASKTVESDIPIVGMDYFFMTKSVTESKNELKEKGEDADAMVEEGRALKCLIVRDQKSKALFGHPVPQKGVDAKGYSVMRVVEDVKC